MSRPLLSLLMMLKNEEANIEGVLQAVRPHIDHWTIFIDDQTTDRTKKIVQEMLHDVPGSLIEAPWLGYAKTRNFVMQVDAQGKAAEFQLFLSADEYLRNGEKLREHLEAQRESEIDCHFLWLKINSSANRQPRVFRTGSAWHYDDFDCGVHEVPVNRSGARMSTMHIDEAHIEFITSDHDRRYEAIEHVHIPMLRAALQRNPNNERALMLLAQSHEALMPYYEPEEKIEFAEEAIELLTHRLLIPTGEGIERDRCALQILDFARLTGKYNDMKLYDLAEQLFLKDPCRPEAALMAATLAMQTQKFGVPKLYELFKRVVEVGMNAGKTVDSVPVSTSCIWQAHYYCAVLAKQLSKQAPEFIEIARQHVSAGMEAGGSWEIFGQVGAAIAELST